MSEVLDQARAPRPGEEIDAGRLGGYLERTVPGARGPWTIEQFPSGHSNLTYLVRGGSGAYVLRRPPFGSKVATAHDMGREFRVLSHLKPAYPLVPRVVAFCEDPGVLGAPFYLMERVEGLILRKSPPEGLDLSPPVMRRLSESFIDNLALLHSIDPKRIGLEGMGHPEGYVARQVNGWTERYHGSKTDEIPSVEEAAAWLRAKMPRESGAAIIHNDYKYDNLVLDPKDPPRILAVLDWEMATVGDPLMDLGSSLGYWVEEGDPEEIQATRMGVTYLPGNLTRRELVERYEAKTGRRVQAYDFYYAFALFKLAVIIQQIYYRYAKGLTKDERFASLIIGVHILMKRAAEIARSSKL